MDDFPPLPPEAPAPPPITPRRFTPEKRVKSVWARRLARPLFYLFSVLITGLVLGAIAVIVLFHMFSKDLPDSGKLAKYQPAGMTRLYANDGSLMAEYAKERRIFVPFRQIPKKVVQAFVAAEDQNFYSHRGVDPMGIARAFAANLRNYSTGTHSLVGGSTITQQVVKNFLLSREKSYDRKIKEAILALRITQTYSKEKILELYLNEIYLGMGSYGVVAAADEYFGKELNSLSTEEVALLAAMPKAPAYYDPRKRPDEALTRRNYVLGRMEEDGYINAAEYQRALATPLTLADPREAPASNIPFYAEEVRRWLLAKYGEETLYKGNLFVKTSVNPALQTMMDTALRHTLVAYDRRHGYRGALLHLESLNGWQDALSLLAKDTPIYDDQRLAVVMGADAKAATIAFLPEKTPNAVGGKDAIDNEGTYLIPLEGLKWARPVLPSGRVGASPKRASDVLKVGDVVVVSPFGDIATQWALEQIPEVSGAMVAMQPQTGEVLAMSGGYSFGRSSNRLYTLLEWSVASPPVLLC
jgi:penicillin-binding protein 1A